MRLYVRQPIALLRRAMRGRGDRPLQTMVLRQPLAVYARRPAAGSMPLTSAPMLATSPTGSCPG